MAGRNLFADDAPQPKAGRNLLADETSAPPSRPTETQTDPVTKSLRLANQFAGGLSDSLYEGVAALPEAAAWALRSVGVPGIPDAGYYTQGAKDVGQAVGQAVTPDVDIGPSEPQGRWEKAARTAGDWAGDAATFIVPGAAAARLAPAGSVAANAGRVMSSQPATQVASGAVGGAVAGATDSDLAGMGAAMATPVGIAGLRRAVTPIVNNLSGEERRLAQLAEQAGIRLTAGQATGSRPLQTMESTLAQMPGSSGPQQRIYDAQRQAFNRAVLSHAGVNADNAAPAVLDDAFRTLGQQFDDMVARTDLATDPQFFRAVDRAAAEYGRRLDTNIKPVFQSYVDDINQMRTGVTPPGFTGTHIDGRTYQNIASDIRTAVRENQNRNPALARALRGLQDAFDDAVERSVGPEVRQDWREVRRQYRNLLQINAAMSKGTQTDRVAGDIPFGGFTNAVRSADQGGYGRGRGELNDLSRVGDFLSNKIPNSGTPERTQMINLLKGGPFVTGGAGAYVSGGDPLVTAASFAAPYAIPPVVQRVMNSAPVQAYLRNQLLAGAPQNVTQTMAKVLAGQSGAVVPE